MHSLVMPWHIFQDSNNDRELRSVRNKVSKAHSLNLIWWSSYGLQLSTSHAKASIAVYLLILEGGLFFFLPEPIKSFGSTMLTFPPILIRSRGVIPFHVLSRKNSLRKASTCARSPRACVVLKWPF